MARALLFWFHVRLSRFRLAVFRAAFAFGLLCYLRVSCAVLWLLWVRSNSTVPCFSVSRPSGFGWQQFGSRRCVLGAAVPSSQRRYKFSAYLSVGAVSCFVGSLFSLALALLSSFVSMSLLKCGVSAMALVLCFCGAARLRGFRRLWRSFSAIQTTPARTSQHTAQQGAAPDRLQPALPSLVPRFGLYASGGG